MSRTTAARPPVSQHAAAVLAAIAVLLAGAVIWLLLPSNQSAPGGAPAQRDTAPSAAATAAQRAESARPRETAPAADPGPARIGPSAPPTNPDADGRSGSIEGTVRRDGRALPDVTVRLVAGLDREVATATDADGRYRLAPLHPGATRLGFELAGATIAERDVTVRPGIPTGYELDATPGPDLIGTVAAPDGTRIVGARVVCDAQETWSGPGGRFALRRSAGGRGLVQFTHDGFAPRAVPTWPTGTPIIKLQPGGTLVVDLPAVAEPGEAWLYVLPTSPEQAATWSRLMPVRVQPGQQLRITDLPAADVELRAFHAFAESEAATARIRAGKENAVALRWRRLPLLQGQIVDDRGPVAGAEVELLASDQYEANSVALGSARSRLQLLPFEALPAAHQRAVTDQDGRFCFARPQLRRSSLWLTAQLGARRAARRLEAGAGQTSLLLPR